MFALWLLRPVIFQFDFESTSVARNICKNYFQLKSLTGTQARVKCSAILSFQTLHSWQIQLTLLAFFESIESWEKERLHRYVDTMDYIKMSKLLECRQLKMLKYQKFGFEATTQSILSLGPMKIWFGVRMPNTKKPKSRTDKISAFRFFSFRHLTPHQKFCNSRIQTLKKLAKLEILTQTRRSHFAIWHFSLNRETVA